MKQPPEYDHITRTDSIHHRPGGVDALSRLAEDNERLRKENDRFHRELRKVSSAATRKSKQIKSLESQLSDCRGLLNQTNQELAASLSDEMKTHGFDPSPAGELCIMGNIEVSESNGPHLYRSALLITFDTHEDIRKAISMGRCEFSFGGKS